MVACCIERCKNPAVVVIESYPDSVALCSEHRGLHDDPFSGGLLPWEREIELAVEATDV
jgi:hypothetical protein